MGPRPVTPALSGRWREIRTQRLTGRAPRDDRGGDRLMCLQAERYQGLPVATRSSETGGQRSLEPFKRNWLCQHPDFELWASRTVRINVYSWKPPSCGALLHSPRPLHQGTQAPHPQHRMERLELKGCLPWSGLSTSPVGRTAGTLSSFCLCDCFN